MSLALSGVVENILGVACDCAEECGYDFPECAFVSHGPPAVDCCDIFAVWVDSKVANAQQASCICLLNVTIVAQHWFCYPILDVTHDGGIAIEQHYDDVTAISTSELDCACTILQGVTLYLSGALDEHDQCAHKVVPTLRAIPPLGGCAGWQYTWTIQGVLL